MNLTERWKQHTISQKLDLRAKLIDAIAEHEGWEESAIALVDESIWPIIHKELSRLEEQIRREYPIKQEYKRLARWNMVNRLLNPPAQS